MAKIMLVEDDNNLREIYEARLQAEGYVIVSAKDGEEALVLAKNEHPDLIIADVMMPKVSGFEMLDILRNTDGLRDTKIIMLTALGQSEDQTRADKLGADRYLVKSQVTLEDIVKVAHDLLNETTESEPAVTTDEPVVATPETTVPVAVPTADSVPTTDYSVLPVQATTTPPTTYTDTPDVAPVNQPITTEPAVAETTAEEESEVESKIESFIANNPSIATPEPSEVTDSTTNDADNSQTMTDAIDNLMAKPRPEPTPEPTEPKTDAVAPTEVAAPIDLSVPVLITPTVPITDGNVPIAHKKIISPIDDVTSATPKTDINVLLAQEEAKDKALNTMPTEPQSPDTAQGPDLPFDPNNISL